MCITEEEYLQTSTIWYVYENTCVIKHLATRPLTTYSSSMEQCQQSGKYTLTIVHNVSAKVMLIKTDPLYIRV